jgi:hypothetical protein
MAAGRKGTPEGHFWRGFCARPPVPRPEPGQGMGDRAAGSRSRPNRAVAYGGRSPCDEPRKAVRRLWEADLDRSSTRFTDRPMELVTFIGSASASPSQYASSGPAFSPGIPAQFPLRRRHAAAAHESWRYCCSTTHPGCGCNCDLRATMVDVLTPEQRSYNMSRIRSRDTKPEMLLRRGLHARGFRFRIQGRDLPGRLIWFFREGEPSSGSWMLLARARLPDVSAARNAHRVLAQQDRRQPHARRKES